jgi:hypothetical protein
MRFARHETRQAGSTAGTQSSLRTAEFVKPVPPIPGRWWLPPIAASRRVRCETAMDPAWAASSARTANLLMAPARRPRGSHDSSTLA